MRRLWVLTATLLSTAVACDPTLVTPPPVAGAPADCAACERVQQRLCTGNGEIERLGISGSAGRFECYARCGNGAHFTSGSSATAAGSCAVRRVFQPPPIGPLCPTRVIAGDREFGGHGPRINAEVSLDTTGGTDVRAIIHFRAKETESDFSETSATWVVGITPFAFSEPMTITALSDTTSSADFVSDPAGFEVGSPGSSPAVQHPPVLGGTLVQDFQIVGDTGGDDISTDDNCDQDTSIRVVFNPVTLSVFPRT